MERYIRQTGIKRHILIVEDELINREILGNLLSSDYVVHYADNGRTALDILRTRGHIFSLILLDLIMPVMDGFEFMETLKKDDVLRTIPVIVMTSEKTAEVRSIRMGAADFIKKPYDMPEVILARCERIIELQEDKVLIKAAERDNLTGLYTKDFFIEYIKNIEKYDPDKKMDLLAINIDHFHLINDIYGRDNGDKVLNCIAANLLEYLETAHGLACRADADYFYLYTENGTDYEAVLSSLNDCLAANIPFANIHLRMGAYVDVDKVLPPESWTDRAKAACDLIRGDYSRHIEYYNHDFYEKTKYQEELIGDVDSSIENGDFIVYYQPKYDISGDKPVLRSAEALIRWNHPKRGMISPGDFIPLFESNGLIQKLDHYVWKEAAAQIGRWKQKYSVSVPVSVNVSRIDLYYPELRDYLNTLLIENGLDKNELLLEITESAYADNAEQIVSVIEKLRNDGFLIEMDDFGSGYSSLNMLTTIPIDALKMDMKFAQNMMSDEKSTKLVELVMDIAKYLNVPVIAEGVETAEQMRLLKDMGCDIIQGYYFSRPVPAKEFEAFIEK